MCEQEGFIREQITVLDKPQPIKPDYLYSRSRKPIQFYKHVRRCWVAEVRCEEQQIQLTGRLTNQPPRGASRVTLIGCALNSSGYQGGDSSQLFPLSEWDSTRTDSWSLKLTGTSAAPAMLDARWKLVYLSYGRGHLFADDEAVKVIAEARACD